MYPCLNESTLSSVPTETFLRAAAHAGFREVELRFTRIWETLDLRPAREIRDLLVDLGLGVASLNSLEEFSLIPEENLALMDSRAEAMFETCRLIGTKVLIVVPSRLTAPLGRGEIRAWTVDRLRRTATMAEPYGVTLAFEPIGTPGYSVRTTAEALAIVREVDMDSESGPLERLTLGSRVLPGEGVVDLRRYAEALRRIDYNGALSVELFNERLWAMAPRTRHRERWRRFGHSWSETSGPEHHGAEHCTGGYVEVNHHRETHIGVEPVVTHRFALSEG